MKTDEQSLQLLAALAARLRADPQFMAHTLAVYQQQRGLDEAGLAAALGAAPELLLRLALCRRPAPEAPAFAAQVRALADYTLLDEAPLLRVIRHVTESNESAARAQTAWPQQFWSRFRRLAAQPAVAFAAGLLLCALTALLGWLVWRAGRATPAPQIARQSQPATPSVTASATPAHEQLAIKTPRHIAPPATSYEIDLEDWAAQRTAETAVKKQPVIIRPPLERVRLRLRLLESSARGSYRVSIISAGGKQRKTRQAYSRDGNKLTVLLNLSRLAPGSYGLRVGRDGAAYVECSLRIVKPTAKSR